MEASDPPTIDFLDRTGHEYRSRANHTTHRTSFLNSDYAYLTKYPINSRRDHHRLISMESNPTKLGPIKPGRPSLGFTITGDIVPHHTLGPNKNNSYEKITDKQRQEARESILTDSRSGGSLATSRATKRP